MQIPAAVGRVLSKLEANNRVSIRSAERQARDEIQDADSAPVRCALARVMLEDWRNGWDELAESGERKAALRKALEALDLAQRRRDRDHWYVDWKRAYVLRYTARALDRPADREASIDFYRTAYQKLSTFSGLPPRRGEKALRSLIVDWAEALVYFEDVPGAMLNYEFTFPWKRRVPDDWHEWSHAFALHQQGDYEASWRKVAALLAPIDNPKGDAPASDTETVIAPKKNKAIHAHYYNDMRLVLAASLARDGQRDKAEAQIDKFQQLRRLAGEKPWTRAIEAERGAFVEGSAGETHWLKSLERAGLPKGEAPPNEPSVYIAATGRGARAAKKKPVAKAPKKSITKKPAEKKTTAKKTTVKKTTVKKKSAAKTRSKAKTKTGAKSKTRVKAKSRTKVKSRTKARTKARTKSKAKSRGGATVRTARKTKAKSRTRIKTKPGRKATVKKARKATVKRKTGAKVRRPHRSATRRRS
jgi:RNA polymerase-associated protein CTR9/transcription factor SPN1